MIPGEKIYSVLTAIAGILAVSLFCGCEDKCPTCPTYKNYYITRVSGDGVSAAVGTSVTLKVLVTDRAGFPIENSRVDWEIVDGKGTLSAETTTTSVKYFVYDIGGEASIELELGSMPGTTTVRASVFANGESVLFMVTAHEEEIQ